VVPEETGTTSASVTFQFEDGPVGAIEHINSFGLNAGNANVTVCMNIRQAESPLSHSQVPVLDVDVFPIIFCVKANARIVCALLVIVEYPMFIEGRRLCIMKNSFDVRRGGKVFVQPTCVEFVLQLLATRAFTT
jgi:hypothetical protein